MFGNKEFEGIYYSRFIASWVKKAGKIDWRFKEWLATLTINGKNIPEEVIHDIYIILERMENWNLKQV